jgi:hypothetical protein
VRRLATLAALSLIAYVLLIRPRIVRWGATDEEVNSPFPGADLIADGTRGPTMSVTIAAQPDQVWPWLVQMGYGRAGWYSWDYLDNFGRRSAETLHREWQDVRVGDYLGGPNVSELERTAWEVAAIEPQRFLGLRASFDLRGRRFSPSKPRPRYHSDSLWGFLLKELPGGNTRLVVSGYWSFRPKWLFPIVSFALYEWTHWIMQTRQFANLKRLTEQHAAPSPPAILPL